MTAKLNDVDPQAWLADRESRRIPLKDINVRALAQHTSTPPLTRGKIQFPLGNKSRSVTDTFLNDLS